MKSAKEILSKHATTMYDQVHSNHTVLSAMEEYAQLKNRELLEELKTYAEYMSDPSSKTFLYNKIIEKLKP